ncbi:MAG: hypothetical protein RLZZ414_1148 [Bacteroidota bacterium]|jgi:endonuclease G
MRYFFVLILISQFTWAQNFNVPNGQDYLFNGVYYYKFNYSNRVSNWVGYTLKPEYAMGNTDNDVVFYEDPALRAGPRFEEFYNRGYALAQMFPQAEGRYNLDFMKKAHSLSNVLPMDFNLHQTTWRVLDNLVRSWAVIFDSVNVITGPMYLDEKPRYLYKGEIRIPSHFFKAVLIYNELDMAAVGFIIPNQPMGTEVGKFMYTIDSLQIKTGLTFFGDLPDYIAHYLKKEIKQDILKEGSYSYMLKSRFVQEKPCIATTEAGHRCDVKTKCVTQTCWKHGCKQMDIGRER